MVLRKILHSLEKLSLYSLCEALLQQWNTNYIGYSEHFLKEIEVLIPPTIQEKLFDLMVDSQARLIQNGLTSTPSRAISLLVNSIIHPTLINLNLNCLANIGFVQDEERELFLTMLVCKLPCLGNLVDISLRASGQYKPITLPICTDQILQIIGSTCSNLKFLDVSYNLDVTDKGLWFLIPCEEMQGCPKLVRLSLFECSVTNEGITTLLVGLPELKFLGHRETGQSLKTLYYNQRPHRVTRSRPRPTIEPLKLVTLNNLGCPHRPWYAWKKLVCNSKFVNIISLLCPLLNVLRVRVNDSQVWCLQEVTTITFLELVYCLGNKLSSPGDNTVQYLQVCGKQFVQLVLVCQTFSSLHLKVICEQCNNLKWLKIKSGEFKCDTDITRPDKEKCVLKNLEKFNFMTGYNVYDLCHIPCNIFSYVLHKSYVLTEVVLTMKNRFLSKFFVEELFSSIETSRIRKIKIQVPTKRQAHFLSSEVSLDMGTLEFLIDVCPELEELKQLLMWEVSSEEIEELRKHLQLTNSALVI